jgi:hypothetical protein
VYFGRCRSGKRWFWCSGVSFDRGRSAEGWVATEDEAWTAMMAAVLALVGKGKLIRAGVSHGIATHRLKEINEAKRRARPAPNTKDGHAVEYLYARSSCSDEGGPCLCSGLTGTARWNYHILKFQITKKTKKRIFYARKALYSEEFNDYLAALGYASVLNITEKGIGFVDRQEIERNGEIWTRKTWQDDWHLYLRPPEPDAEDAAPAPDLRALKAAMADAHPDRGGTSEAFIKARRAYEAAQRASCRGGGTP